MVLNIKKQIVTHLKTIFNKKFNNNLLKTKSSKSLNKYCDKNQIKPTFYIDLNELIDQNLNDLELNVISKVSYILFYY
jgi:hypothetical protein